MTTSPSHEADAGPATGVVNVPYEIFTCGPYRYSNLADALSEGRRQHPTLAPASEPAAIEAYGIVRQQVDCFHYGNYRYSRLGDANAEAQRHGPGAQS
jgi:hypothetical protein